VQSSVLSIYSSTFSRSQAYPNGGFLDIEYSTLLITNSSFSNGQADKGGCLNARESLLKIADSSFTQFSGGVLFLEQMIEVSIEGSSFSNSTSAVLSAVVCINCGKFSANSSEFTHASNLFSNLSFGGALELSVTSESYQKAVFTIDHCHFLGCSSQMGGAIFVGGVNVWIGNSEFRNNEASLKGGGVYLGCLDVYKCWFVIVSSTFTGNSAAASGGAIYWDRYAPTRENMTFSGNTAVHGDDVATYSAELTIETYLDPYRRLTGNVLTGAVSGQPLQPVTIKLRDSLGQVVTTDSTSAAEIRASDTSTMLSGVTKVVAKRGVFVFEDVVVSVEPGTSGHITYWTDSISNRGEVNVTVETRLCIIGEEQVGNSCNPCRSGTYSLEPGNICADCPSEAYCYGNFSIVPRKTYWRASIYSDMFYKCPNEDACLGSNEAEMKLLGSCAEGYQGNKCQGCRQGYSRSSDNKCGGCPDKTANGIRLTFIIVLAMGVCGVIVNSTIKSAYEPKAVHSIYFKILANYLQLVMLVGQLNLEWPNIVLDYMNAQNTAGSIGNQILSLDCYLEDDTDPDSFKKVYFQRVTLTATIPIMLCAASLVAWFIIVSWHRKVRRLSMKVTATIVVLMFLVHPSLTNYMFSVFNCVEIQSGKYWLASNLNIECWDDTHTKYAIGVALPFVLMFSLALPASVLVFLVRRRRLLDRIYIRICFGFLFNGYRRRHFYWEFVIIFRKILIICVTVFLNPISIPIQSLFIFLIFNLSYYLQYRVNPFKHVQLNQVERIAIFVACITIYCGMFFLTKDLDEPSKLVLFGMMVASNAYFLCIWALNTFKVSLKFLRKYIPFIRKWFSTEHIYEASTIVKSPLLKHSTYFEDSMNYSMVPIKAHPKQELFDEAETLQLLNSKYLGSLVQRTNLETRPN
jgi:hypothetical protein